MLREFRRMETAVIKINNLRRRYGNSLKNQPISEYLFVELLCKIPPEDPEDPLSIRPPVAAATSGAAQPQNDRQADLKWLNDMSDDQFYQMMEFIHHNVISQWWRIGWNWIVLAFTTTLAGMGVAGIWMLGVLKILWHVIVRFLRWTSGSLLRITLVVVIAAIVFWPLALLAMVIFRALQGRGATNQSDIKQNGTQIGLFGFIGTMIGVAFLMGIYFKLVPTAVDPELAHAALMAIAATFFFWNVRWVRVSLLLFIAALTIIFFLGGRTAAKNEAKVIWASTGTKASNTRKINDLQETGGKKNKEVAKFRKTSRRKSPHSDNNVIAESGENQPADQNGESVPPAPPARVQWFKPITGNEGGYTILTSSGRYIAVGKVGFRLSIQPPADGSTEGLYLNESDGGDNMGSFSAYPNAIAENFIHCTGDAYPCKMFPGTPTYLNVEVDRPSGVTKFAFGLKIAPGGGAWIEYDFANIPVTER